MQQKNTKLFIIPLISLSIFTILIFGAGYAYYIANTTMNTSNYQISLPKQTSLVCTKTDCGVTVTPAQMSTSNTNASTAAATSTCYVNCTCSGTPGSVCNYNVSLLEYGMPYTKSASLGTSNEFTVRIVSPSGCTAQNSSSTANQVQNMYEKKVSACSLTVPDGGSISANVTAEFKWYNLNIDQAIHANKEYKYQLTTEELIPDAYQRVEYIQNNGTNYIDTGYIPDYSKNLNFEVVNTPTVSSKRYCLLSNYSDANHLSLEINNNQGRIYYNNSTINQYYGTHSTSAKNYYLVDYFTTQKKYRLSNNGDFMVGNMNATGVSASNLLLFVDQQNRFSTFNTPIKIYSVKIAEGGVLERNMIPCIRISDSVSGMYDIIHGVFYSDPGGTNFTTGSNV